VLAQVRRRRPQVLIVGPVGVGKTFMASALGHVAVRRRYTVSVWRTNVLLKRLWVSRLDDNHDVEILKLIPIDSLILEGFALQAFEPLDTADVYELIVKRHRAASDCHLAPRARQGLSKWPMPYRFQSTIDRL
jgi:DNA replication protein DnaC